MDPDRCLGPDHPYTYDDLHRLTGETVASDPHGNNGVVSYSLDAVGNRLSRVSSIATLTSQLNRTYNARDWLSGDTYTANGSTQVGRTVLGEPSGTDVYDFEEHLILRTKPDGSSINVSYDADGNRVQKTLLDASAAVTSTTTWLVDTNNLTGYPQVVEERTVHGGSTPSSTQTIYTYGSDRISQAVSLNSQPSTLNYFSYDGHGSVRELTDASGTVTDRYDYDAFGNQVFRAGGTVNAYLYCGEQYDADLGLYYNRARYLNTDSARFWSMDSYEGSSSDPLSLHKFLYANANPVAYSDPSGFVGLLDTQIGQAIDSTLNKISQVNLRFVMRKSGCWAVKLGLEKGIQSGIYVFLDASGAGGFYTGMSVDIERRLIEHSRRVVQPILRISANVSPQVLRQLEQTIYNIVKESAAVTGKNTTNKINPLREQLRRLLSKAIPLC